LFIGQMTSPKPVGVKPDGYKLINLTYQPLIQSGYFQIQNLWKADNGSARLRPWRCHDMQYTKEQLKSILKQPGPLDLANVDLGGADLSGANLQGAYLVGADLGAANLTGANLAKALLWGAHLIGANLDQANLSGSGLDRADLSKADLTGADLNGAVLKGAKYDQNTKWPAGFDPAAAGAIFEVTRRS
jgi:uncharacterized protein YjbI with pentapeptide repeats